MCVYAYTAYVIRVKVESRIMGADARLQSQGRNIRAQ
jgi:hypothetical protein